MKVKTKYESEGSIIKYNSPSAAIFKVAISHSLQSMISNHFKLDKSVNLPNMSILKRGINKMSFLYPGLLLKINQK